MCFARCFYTRFTKCFARFLEHAYKVCCKAFGAVLQGVLRGVVQHVYKVVCKAFTTCLQGVYNMFTRCFARLLQHVTARDRRLLAAGLGRSRQG